MTSCASFWRRRRQKRIGVSAGRRNGVEETPASFIVPWTPRFFRITVTPITDTFSAGVPPGRSENRLPKVQTPVPALKRRAEPCSPFGFRGIRPKTCSALKPKGLRGWECARFRSREPYRWVVQTVKSCGIISISLIISEMFAYFERVCSSRRTGGASMEESILSPNSR